MYKFTNFINEAINQCKQNGNANIYLHDAENTIICAEWEESEIITGHDIITIYFYQNDRIMFRMEIEETKTKI